MLAVETIGKNISGTGMDPAVIARYDIRGRPNPPAPAISKLVVLGLTPETHGNGLGVGSADYTTKAVADQLDLYAMYMNACTATFTERVRDSPPFLRATRRRCRPPSAPVGASTAPTRGSA